MSVGSALQDVNTRVLDVAVRVCSMLGVFAFGVAVGMTLLGSRFDQCPTIGGEVVGETCMTLAWASSTAQSAAVAGGALLFAGIIVEKMSRVSAEESEAQTQ